MLKLNKMEDILDSKGIWLTEQLSKSVCAINCSARDKYQPELEKHLENLSGFEVGLKDLINNENKE